MLTNKNGIVFVNQLQCSDNEGDWLERVTSLPVYSDTDVKPATKPVMVIFDVYSLK